MTPVPKSLGIAFVIALLGLAYVSIVSKPRVEAELERKTRELADTRTNAEENTLRLERSSKALQERLDKATVKVKSCLEDRETDKVTWNKLGSTKDADVSRAKAEIKDAEATLERVKTELSAKDASLEQALLNLQEVKDENEEYKKTVADLQERISGLETEEATLKAKSDAEQLKHSEFVSTCERRENRCKEMSSELENCRSSAAAAEAAWSAAYKHGNREKAAEQAGAAAKAAIIAAKKEDAEDAAAAREKAEKLQHHVVPPPQPKHSVNFSKNKDEDESDKDRFDEDIDQGDKGKSDIFIGDALDAGIKHESDVEKENVYESNEVGNSEDIIRAAVQGNRDDSLAVEHDNHEDPYAGDGAQKNEEEVQSVHHAKGDAAYADGKDEEVDAREDKDVSI